MNNLISIYQTYNSFEVELIKSHFDAEKIFCMIRENDASGVLPHLGFSQGGTEILVRQKDVENAQKILKLIQESEA